MVPILGRSLILISLLVASAGAIVAFFAGAKRNETASAWARRMAYTYAAVISAANFLMIYALVKPDFSV